jgi:hypothetical protein
MSGPRIGYVRGPGDDVKIVGDRADRVKLTRNQWLLQIPESEVIAYMPYQF